MSGGGPGGGTTAFEEEENVRAGSEDEGKSRGGRGTRHKLRSAWKLQE